MTANATDRLAEIAAELDAELREASYVVHDDDSAAALTAAGLGAVCSARMSEVLRDAARCLAQGVPVVIVAAVDGTLRDYLGTTVGVEIRDVPLPRAYPSVAALLGYSHGARWDAETATAKARTWLDYCQRIARISIAADDEGSAFPVDALPTALRRMVIVGARAQSVDVGFWTTPLLGILSGCVGASRSIRLSADWTEPAVLWTALVAPSGAGKSPPLYALLDPVREVDYALHLRTVEAMRSRKSASDDESNGTKSPPPPWLGVLVEDITLEGLAVRLGDNPRGLLLAIDELASWVRSFDRYRGRGGDAQQWLSIHGARALKVDRKGGGDASRLYIKRAAVAVTGTIQPSIARRFLGGDQETSSGLTARLLLAMPPTRPAVWSDRTIPDDVRASYARVVRALLDLTHDDDKPRALRVTREARDEFVEFHDANGAATHAAATDGDEGLAAALSKLRGAAPRIALLVALARAAETGTAEILDVVSVEDMRAGIRIAKWFEGEARRLYAEWSHAAAAERADRETGSLQTLASRLGEILRKRGPTSTDELHDLTGKNNTGARLHAALALAGAECSEVQHPRGGRRRKVWTLPEGVSP